MLTKQKSADCVKCIRTLDARAFIPRPRGVLAALVGIIFFSGSSYAATVVFQQWAQRYDGPSHDYDQPYAGVVVDSAGNSYVSGPSANRGLFWDWATVKYDANGTRLWVSTFGLTGSVDNWSNAVSLDPSGNAIVVGAIGGVNLNGDSRKPNSSFVGANFATVKYASNGNELWSRTYNANNNEDIANAVTTDASGNVYVTGQSVGSFVRPDFATIKYDSSGNLEWVARYHGTPEFSYTPASIAVSGGFVYVTGQGGSIGTGADIVTIKYPATCSNPCSAVWVSTFNSSGNGQDVAAKIAVSAAGNIYVSGYIRFSDWVVVAYDPSGTQLWSARRPAGGNVSRGMTLDAAGNVYVTGDSNPGGQVVATTAKFNGSTGAVMWANTYGGPPNGLGVQGSGNAITLDSSGNAYVTGGYVVSATNNNYDVATVKYDANGAQQWLKTYNGPGNGEDVGLGLGLDSAGNIFVAGNSVGVGTGSSDFASIRYTQGNGVPVALERFTNTNLNTPVSITMAASDVDGDPLSFSIVASPANGALGPITNTSCAAGSCTAQVNYTPASGFFGLDTFTFKATDGTIDSNIASSSIAVNSPNGSPVFPRWAQRYDGSSHDYDQPYAGVVVDSAGNSYVSGPSADRGLFWDWATVKYDASGSRLWVSTFGLTGSVDNWSNAVTLDPAGNAIVVGAIGGVNLNGDSRKPNSSFVGANFATVKYDPNGNALWSRTYNANNNEDIANAVTTDANGNVYVTGQSVGSFVRQDFATIKYDSNGNQEWVARYHGTPEFSYIPTAIAVSGGYVYVTGQGGSLSTGADIVTIKYPVTCSNPCSAVWVSTFNSSGNGQDVAAKIAVSAAGNIYVSGYIRFSDWVVVAYDPSGNQLWSARRPAGGNASRGMTLDAAGNVYVTGDSNPGGQVVATTAKFNGSTGAVMWVNTFGGPPNFSGVQGSGNAIVLDASGNAYVTGGYVVSATNNNYDVATVKYDANGVQQWLQTYNGPGNGEDIGLGLGLDSAGNVFVTGNSVGVGTGSSDFVTIKHALQPTFSATSADTEVGLTSYNPSLTITAVSTATPAVSLALASVTLQGLVLVSAVYDIDPSTPLNPPGTLTFRFDPAVVLDTSTLAIYRYNGVNWSSAAITGQIVFDMPNPRVVGNLAHTSLYALFVEQPDRLPPALTLTPVNGSTTTSATPPIAAVFFDTGTGVNASSFRLILDGADVTTRAFVTSSSATFVPVTALAQGTHTITASVADFAGNVATTSGVFFLDSIAPVTQFLVNTLATGATNVVLISTDSLGFAASDAGTGVVQTFYTLNGATTSVVFVSTFSLAVGTHTLSFHSVDRSGNAEAPKSISLTVYDPDTTAPSLSLTPPTGSTATSVHPAVVASYSDSGRGIDLTTVRLLLDGLDVTSQTVVAISSAIFVPVTALSQGTHTVTAIVVDIAGNQSSALSNFFVDSIAPATTLFIDGLAASATSLVIITTDTIGFTAMDSGTGVLHTLYSLDGSTEAVFVSTFSLPAGSHNLSFHSVDLAGNIEAAKTVALAVLAIDTTSPSIAITPPDRSTITTATPLIAVSYSDSGRGIDASSVRLILDGVDVSAQSQITAASATFTSPSALSQSTHTVTAQVADLAGNAAGASSRFFIDSIPPVTVLQINGASASTGSHVLVSTDSVGFAAFDAGTGVLETRFALDAGVESVFSSTFSLSPGTHTLAFRSLDIAGNSEAVQSSSIQVLLADAAAPYLALAPPSGSTVTSAAPLLTANYSDTGRGVDPATLRLSLDGVDITTQAVIGASSATVVPSSPLSQGFHVFAAQIADFAGNSTASNSTFLVDSLPPITTLLVNGLPSSTTSLVLVSTDSLDFSATDSGVGVLETRYSLDGSTTEAVFVSTFSLAAGAHSLAFHSADRAGNVEPAKTIAINVQLFDVTPPSLTLSPINASTLTITTPALVASYSDLGRGVDPASVRLSLDGADRTSAAAVTSSSASFTPGAALSQGTHTVTASVSDLAGNAASVSSSFFIDSLPPLTTLLVNGMTASTTGLVIVSTDSVGFSAFDAGTGVLTTRYALDVAAEAVFTSTFSLSVGTHTLAYRSLDRAGNAEATRTVSVSVLFADGVAPTLTLTPASGSTVTTTTPSLVASYADSGRGVDPASVKLTLDGLDVTAQALITASSAAFTPIAALAQGTHTATAEIADRAGNRATTASTFFIDSLAPATTLLVNGLANGATNLALSTSDNLGFSATDGGVGVLETRYALDGGADIVFSSTFSLTAGNHALNFRSLDRAGNAETPRAVSIQVTGSSSDTTPPLVRLDFPGGSGLGVEQAIGGVVNVRGAVSDASSLTWTLEAAPGAAATSGFTTIASGSGNLSGLIAAWNTTSLSGYQTLRLRATDAFGNTASAAATVFVGNPVFNFAIGRKDSNVIVNKIKNPTGIAVRADGLIWVASTDEDELILLTSSGTVVAEVDGENGHGHEHGHDDDEGFKNPQGLALDAASNLYVADKGNNRVVKLSADGSQVLLQIAKLNSHGKPQSGSGPGELRRPQDVAVDANGDIYVADSGNSRIQVFNAAGTLLRQFGPGVLLSTSEVRGIALTSEGLWVSDKEQERVFLFSRAGALIKSIGDADSVVGELSRMRGLASDRLGALYIVEPNRDRTQKFDPQGKGLLAFGSKTGLSHADKQAKRYLTQPIDATVAPDGSIWITDTGRDRIVRYALPATGYGVASYSAGGGSGSSLSVELAKRVVDHKDGAKVERDDGAGVTVPKGALAADLEITVDKGDENLDKEQKTAKRKEMKIQAVSEEVQYGPEGTVFNAPVTLTLPYDANLIASLSIKEDELKVYYWNPTLKDWQAMPSTVDKQNKTVNAQTTHFSAYQVGGLGGIGVAALDDFGLRDGYAFPNPSRNGAAVTFRMQPGSVDSIEVRVYDVSGRKIHSSSDFRFLGAIDDGNGKGVQNTYDHVWDVSGVGSGVYTYVMTARKAGQSDIRKTGKIGVIK